jgi:hypothetical protein
MCERINTRQLEPFANFKLILGCMRTFVTSMSPSADSTSGEKPIHDLGFETEKFALIKPFSRFRPHCLSLNLKDGRPS